MTRPDTTRVLRDSACGTDSTKRFLKAAWPGIRAIRIKTSHDKRMHPEAETGGQGKPDQPISIVRLVDLAGSDFGTVNVRTPLSNFAKVWSGSAFSGIGIVRTKLPWARSSR